MAYVISHKHDPSLLWNNTKQTWEKDDYDTFSWEEKAYIVDLPPRGIWEEVPWSKAS